MEEDQVSVVNHYPSAKTTQSCQHKVATYIQNIKTKKCFFIVFTLCKLGFADIWCIYSGCPRHWDIGH